MSQRIERLPLNRVAVTSFVVCLAVGAVISALLRNDAPVIALALIGGPLRRSARTRFLSYGAGS
jgi:hypothetical protein